MDITHSRVEITVTKVQKACPYCKKRPLIRATCGQISCQWKHHILTMRKDRKTEQVRPSRRIKIEL